MDLKVEWHQPLALTKSNKVLFDENSVPDTIPSNGGVYFFSRRFGNNYLPFYIGETANLRQRLREHLRTVAIVDVLRGIRGTKEIKQGTRYFHYGILLNDGGKAAQKRRRIIQRHMIRTAVEYRLPILNKQLTKIKTNTFEFGGPLSGRGWFDKQSISEAN